MICGFYFEFVIPGNCPDKTYAIIARVQANAGWTFSLFFLICTCRKYLSPIFSNMIQLKLHLKTSCIKKIMISGKHNLINSLLDIASEIWSRSLRLPCFLNNGILKESVKPFHEIDRQCGKNFKSFWKILNWLEEFLWLCWFSTNWWDVFL